METSPLSGGARHTVFKPPKQQARYLVPRRYSEHSIRTCYNSAVQLGRWLSQRQGVQNRFRNRVVIYFGGNFRCVCDGTHPKSRLSPPDPDVTVHVLGGVSPAEKEHEPYCTYSQ